MRAFFSRKDLRRGRSGGISQPLVNLRPNEAVAEDGGDANLRERVAALDDGQRRLLREALDEVSIAS